MHRFMAACAPASAARQTRGVLLSTDENHPSGGLLLGVAFQAEGGVAIREHPLIHRAMRLMARCAAFPEGLVLEDKRTALRRVASPTGIKLGGE